MTTRLTRTERRAQTRQELLDAAARVFVERGFAGASIEAITAEAGYTRGAFYSNFNSKEELFAELLQQRAYAVYRDMAEASARGERQSFAEVGRRLAAIQEDADGSWLFSLWLELLAHAARDESFRTIASGFWSITRANTAAGTENAFREAGQDPPAPPDHLA